MSRSSHAWVVIILFASIVVTGVGIGARTAQAQNCLLNGLDGDSDNLCGNWETGCNESGRARTDRDDADSDNDLIRDDVEVGASGAPASGMPGAAINFDGDAAGIDGCDADSD